VAFEYRGKRDSVRWRCGWDGAIFVGSLLPAILWGVAFGNIVRGIRLNAAGNYVGSFFDLLNPYALLGGLTTLALFVTHGAIFLSLKTTGDVRARARAAAGRTGIVALAFAAGFLSWTQVSYGGLVSALLAGLAALALAAGIAANLSYSAPHERIAFTGTAVAIAAATVSLFVALYPDVLPSTINTAYSLTVSNASATAKTLAVMTVVAVIFLPLVLLYQGWTYWVFRKRIGAGDIPGPVALAGPPEGPTGSAGQVKTAR
jgi:cytochrome d ubiquinol oxidase subunit II